MVMLSYTAPSMSAPQLVLGFVRHRDWRAAGQLVQDLQDKGRPPWELVHGRLAASAAAVKRRYPHAITHINLQFRTITNASVPPILGAASSLDWVGSDLYYSDNTVQPPVNASVVAFREIYNRVVYPHLRPDQKIVLVPFAHCKRSIPL